MSLSFTLRIFHLLALVTVFVGSVKCLPRAGKNPSTLTSGNHKISGRDQEIIARARSVQKPKGYERIVQRAKQLTNMPEPFGEEYIPRKAVRGKGYTNDPLKLWNYTMLIVIDKKYTKKDRLALEAAIYTLKTAMECFDFKIVPDKLSPLVDHVFITPEKRRYCASFLGRKQGIQKVNLSLECLNLYGVGMHELMHALGFWHEHSRVDRDEYVDVHFDEISKIDSKNGQLAYNYGIVKEQNLISEYDFESILHYKFNELMTPKVYADALDYAGQRDHLSDLDLKRLHTAYPCNQ